MVEIMGTDIYLSYDGQSEEDEKLQCSELFNSTALEFGYIGSAIWMEEENKVLRILFDNEFWDCRVKFSYNFDENIKKLKAITQQYILGMPLKYDDTKTKKMCEVAVNFSRMLGVDLQKGSADMDIDKKLMWITSVHHFFKLGSVLQKRKLNPKVYIGW